MSKTDSMVLWRSKIQNRKLSCPNVNEWCE
ncbi:hypothetical protein HNQ54_001750 [Anaerocolumna cellulosilytica]|nr:hypothetical protein [Anaerocolumna cellulosilytica]